MIMGVSVKLVWSWAVMYLLIAVSSDSLDLANSNSVIISSSVFILDSWSRIKESMLDSKD